VNELFVREVRIKTDAAMDYSVYPFSLPIIKNLKSLPLNRNVTFLVGENGAGKSTLLEAIAVNFGFNPEGGSRNFNFSTKQTHSQLHEHITLVKGVRKAKDGYLGF
jgi:predicted ATPase